MVRRRKELAVIWSATQVVTPTAVVSPDPLPLELMHWATDLFVRTPGTRPEAKLTAYPHTTLYLAVLSKVGVFSTRRKIMDGTVPILWVTVSYTAFVTVFCSVIVPWLIFSVPVTFPSATYAVMPAKISPAVAVASLVSTPPPVTMPPVVRCSLRFTTVSCKLSTVSWLPEYQVTSAGFRLRNPVITALPMEVSADPEMDSVPFVLTAGSSSTVTPSMRRFSMSSGIMTRLAEKVPGHAQRPGFRSQGRQHHRRHGGHPGGARCGQHTGYLRRAVPHRDLQGQRDHSGQQFLCRPDGAQRAAAAFRRRYHPANRQWLRFLRRAEHPQREQRHR